MSTKERNIYKAVQYEVRINDLNYKISLYTIISLYDFLAICEFENFKFILFAFFCIILIYIYIFNLFYNGNRIDIRPFKKYIRDCKNLKKYNRKKLYSENPYISICIPALNMENYIEHNLLSILNQSFQNFEIIIVNDGSTDQTEIIIKNIQLTDKRIKLLTHAKKLGVYRSRIESILNSKSKYVILMDPDDMYLNENLFHDLYYYNMKKNLDIIEFSVYQQIDSKNKIYLPDNDFETHYHKFNEKIIYQPELSNILYYHPETKEYSHSICRNVWNKMIRRRIFLQTNNYIGKKYYHENIITADDMMINIISYQFANNYSNVNLPGYLYIKRKVSMSRGGGKKLKNLRAKNYIFYFKLFYKYIKDYNKDINILYYEMKDLEYILLKVKNYNNTKYLRIHLNLLKKILKENNLSIQFKNYLQNITKFLKK